mgnify:CR=1 FL=1
MFANYPQSKVDEAQLEKEKKEAYSHIASSTPLSDAVAAMEDLSFSSNEDRISLDLGVLYQMYDNVDTRDNAMELYTIIEQTLPTIMQHYND